MIQVRKSDARGHFDFGWLDTRHTFSFGDYYDEGFMGFSKLRVINEDRVRAGSGFPTHGHRDMEIISYVLDGELAHQDSMGTGATIRPGEVQRMSAGRGVRHSEWNGSKENPTHFFQIWIEPDRRGHDPGYEQKAFSVEERRGRLRLVASPDGAEGSITIHQDARLYATLLDGGQAVEHAFSPGRKGWVQVARGRIVVGDVELAAGDGAAISDELRVALAAREACEVLLFDLPA